MIKQQLINEVEKLIEEAENAKWLKHVKGICGGKSPIQVEYQNKFVSINSLSVEALFEVAAKLESLQS